MLDYLMSPSPSPQRRPERRPAPALIILSFLFLSMQPALAQSWEMRVCADPNGMPMSHRDGSGYENLIAEIIADELDAALVYDWYPFGTDMIDYRLRQGYCDLIMGVPDGHEPLITSLAYYLSPYAFVYKADAPFELSSFDDPVLAELSIAVQAIGIPPHAALLRRDLGGNVRVDFGVDAYATRPDPRARVVEAVASGLVDVGLAWGPIAGYYGARQEVPLTVRPVQPLFEPPFSTQVFAMTVGMRRGDEALRDEIGIAIVRRWDEIQAVLADFDVVVEPSARPAPLRDLP